LQKAKFILFGEDFQALDENLCLFFPAGLVPVDNFIV